MVDPIWAGQYRFLQPLWEGKERIVFDPQLSGMLLSPGGLKLPWDRSGQALSLVSTLLAQDAGALWLLVPDLHELAQAGVDPTRFGARSLHDGPLLALRRSWDVAIVDVTALLDSMLAEASQLAAEASLVDALLSSLTSQRHLVLWTRSSSADPKRCKRWRALGRLLASRNGPEPQALAVGDSSTMQILPFDEAFAEELFVDQTLGSARENWSYLAYLGPHASLGARCIELPAPAFERLDPKPAKRSRSPLKQRLQAVEAELAKSELARVALLQDLDRASAESASLHEQLEELRDCSEPVKAASGQKTKFLAADEASSHALLLHATWEIERLRGQLAALRARPISEIEAENAQLVAALTELQELVERRSEPQGLSIPTDAEDPESEKKSPAPKPEKPKPAPVQTRAAGLWSQDLSRAQLSLAQSTQALPRAWRGELSQIAASLKGLRARIERGELAPLPLQDKLRELERGVERLVCDGATEDVGQVPPEHVG